MIAIDHLTKRYRNITAVDGLSFEVGPGRVTGFLVPRFPRRRQDHHLAPTPLSGGARIERRRWQHPPSPS